MKKIKFKEQVTPCEAEGKDMISRPRVSQNVTDNVKKLLKKMMVCD